MSPPESRPKEAVVTYILQPIPVGMIKDLRAIVGQATAASQSTRSRIPHAGVDDALAASFALMMGMPSNCVLFARLRRSGSRLNEHFYRCLAVSHSRQLGRRIAYSRIRIMPALPLSTVCLAAIDEDY